MLTPVRSSKFKRDVRKTRKRGKDLSKLRRLLDMLIRQVALAEQYSDHPLRGRRAGCREVHIESDWVLIYRVSGKKLHLVRTGSHSDLFKQ
ncbi:MAG: type II toxin-antitoxin system YafQ family toxin [Gammaproteobacteria bacterium]|nr:type II toxin-antitoxin system YafQ family toxin [Chromatiales bacterium]MYE48070.1 type II toxin-antitoxin system YafQ family toxin [Gammaproteobacteria bacterium]